MTIGIEVRHMHDKYMRKKISHQDYFIWLSDRIGIPESLIPVTLSRLLRSTDPYLNDIHLKIWDNQHHTVVLYVKKSGLRFWSLSDSVCCLKAMARRRVEQLNHLPVDERLTVAILLDSAQQ